MQQLISQLFSQATTGNSAGTTNTSGATSDTTAKVLSPEQQKAQGSISQVIQALTKNPQAFLAPAQNQARNNVNENYGGVADSLRQQFMGGTGGGASGKYGTAALRSDLARRGQLSGVDSTFASEAAMLPVTAAGLAQNLLGVNMGTTSTGKTAGTGSTTQTGTSTTTGQSSGTVDQTSKGNQSGTGFQAGT